MWRTEREDAMIGGQRDYSKLVKELRKQLHLSQEDLARELGVSFNSVNRWEGGKVNPSKMAKNQLDGFTERMLKAGRLKLPKALQT